MMLLMKFKILKEIYDDGKEDGREEGRVEGRVEGLEEGMVQGRCRHSSKPSAGWCKFRCWSSVRQW